MVYANFSSNLPTGLQHFEFVDLTITENVEMLKKRLPVLEFIPLALSGVSEMYLTKLAVHAKRDLQSIGHAFKLVSL